MGEDRAREVLKGMGMTDEEATDFIKGIKQGLKDYREGKMIPLSEVKRRLGLGGADEGAADKQWTMNCILAGVEVARLVRENKLQGATEYLANLTSKLTTTDIEYLITRVIAILNKKEGGEQQ